MAPDPALISITASPLRTLDRQEAKLRLRHRAAFDRGLQSRNPVRIQVAQHLQGQRLAGRQGGLGRIVTIPLGEMLDVTPALQRFEQQVLLLLFVGRHLRRDDPRREPVGIGGRVRCRCQPIFLLQVRMRHHLEAVLDEYQVVRPPGFHRMNAIGQRAQLQDRYAGEVEGQALLAAVEHDCRQHGTEGHIDGEQEEQDVADTGNDIQRCGIPAQINHHHHARRHGQRRQQVGAGGEKPRSKATGPIRTLHGRAGICDAVG